MFAMCCCTDNKESDQNTFHSTTDEGSGHIRLSAEEVGGGGGTYARPTAPMVAPPMATSPSGYGNEPVDSARSLTVEEKEAEKSRLQNLVNNFAKKAVRGCPCAYITEGSGDRVARQYRIDRSLEYLIVVDDRDDSQPEVTCPIAAIQDIYSLVEDGESCFPPEVVAQLRPEEMEMLLMVVYRSGQDKMFRFCLLEENTESRDIFLECLRILCIYAQSAQSALAGEPRR